MKNDPELDTACYLSPIGPLEIKGSDKGIRSILYLDEAPATKAVPESLTSCVQQLDEYFQGNRFRFTLHLDPHGTDFQLRVWEQLREIPFGTTISYLQLALRMGDARTVRAVGHANGQNRLNIVIPCHRVIGANGKLTGYGGGLWRKEWLLKHEIKGSLPGLFSLQD